MHFLWKYFFLVIAVACVTTPETNRKQFIVLPDNQMNSLGAQAYQDLLKKEKVSQNAALNEVVTRIGKRIAEASGEKFAWEYKVIENAKTVNAFCLPGGKIAVYTGIIPVAKNEAALAAIMGHEVAHATARHGAERMSQALALQSGAAITAAMLGNSKNRNLILGALGLGAQFGVMMPFSRSHESEADRIGLIYMAKAGYRPEAAVELWERMAKLGGAQPPEILSTHPSNQTRINEISSQLGSVKGAYESSQKQPEKDLPPI